jgi:hypothetical protein
MPLDLWAMCLAAGLGALQRYLGIALLAASASSFAAGTNFWAPGLCRGWSPAPLGAWVVLHNLPIGRALFGPRELGAMLPLKTSLRQPRSCGGSPGGVLDWLMFGPGYPSRW